MPEKRGSRSSKAAVRTAPKAKAAEAGVGTGTKIRCAYTDLIDPTTLTMHPENPNKHPPAQLATYRAILDFQGWRRAITVSKQSGYVTRGHGALLAALEAGYPAVPVDYQEYDSRESELADIVADNQLQRMSTMDNTKLTELVVYLKSDDAFDIKMLGIDDRQLTKLVTAFDAKNPDLQGQPLAAPPPPAAPLPPPAAAPMMSSGSSQPAPTPSVVGHPATSLVQFFYTSEDHAEFSRMVEFFAKELECSLADAVLHVLRSAFASHVKLRPAAESAEAAG